VDAFLERAGIALDEHHRGVRWSLTLAAVLNKNFQATKFRSGHDQAEVVDLVDQIVAGLRASPARQQEPDPARPRQFIASRWQSTTTVLWR